MTSEEQVLARFRERADAAAQWPHRARLDFDNLDRQSDTLRAVYAALAGGPLGDKCAYNDFWVRLYLDAGGDGLLIDAETGNYGLQITTTRFTLLVGGEACVRTVDVDSDNCAPEGGQFDVSAGSAAALERAVAALVAWHRELGVGPR
jgi:hypothetical protein